MKREDALNYHSQGRPGIVDARHREHAIKKLTRRKKHALVATSRARASRKRARIKR